MDARISNFTDDMVRYLGQTVTIFTGSGGLSGSGFTGVLIGVSYDLVRLLCDIGAPPASAADDSRAEYPDWPLDARANPLGSVCVISTRAIVSFTHNAI
ncbi:MAG: hypothetical protein LBL35_06150 [Clostridiales bacterium]|jgi:hypothetical protein|nr:hypothetical protein [Clostridiales bacterium]